MEMIFGLLFGAINTAFFLVGMYAGKKSKNDAVSITKENMESLKGIAEWYAYGNDK